MTVRELIKKLLEIENIDQEIAVYDNDHRTHNNILAVQNGKYPLDFKMIHI